MPKKKARISDIIRQYTLELRFFRLIKAYNYAKQARAVLLAELVMVLSAFLIAWLFWSNLCPSGLESCLAEGTFTKPLAFLALSAIRPFVFTPVFFVAVIGGKSFGPILGALLTSLGSVLSCAFVFGLTKLFGNGLTKPWLRSNLPATFKLIRSQDYKIVMAARLIPVLPFDLVSIALGLFDFRTKTVLITTFLASLPESYIFARLVDPSRTMVDATINSLLIFAVTLFLPLLVLEFLMRKKGTSMWQRMKASWSEIKFEIQANNEIVRREHFDGSKTPVLLLYGFFSSRRAVTVLEKMLKAKGHEVLSFNLGGLLGTFFTRDILETAAFIDTKIHRQIERHGFKKIHIVAHSKGGMVALWWLLKLGGAKHCDRVVTMGTPFRGSRLTYLALITPLGFFWHDVGQMRPGSTFLRTLHASDIPSSVRIFCMYSQKDRVARGNAGIFCPRPPSSQVTAVPMHHISHFEFLYRRDVGETISRLLRSEDGVATNEIPAIMPKQTTLPPEGDEEVWRQIAGDE